MRVRLGSSALLSLLYPSLLQPRKRECRDQIRCRRNQRLQKGDREMIDPEEQRRDGICEEGYESSADEADLPSFIELHAFVALQNHLNIGIRVGHEEIVLHNFTIGM